MAELETHFLVVGAGAAGLVAAAFAARAGVPTLVIEKGRQTGVKIRIAGGGHCNLTHDCSVRAMLAGFGPAASFLEPTMKAFSPRAVRRYFGAIGVPTYVGEHEKVWPVSRSARQVRDALELDARAAGADIRLLCPAVAVERRADGFVVATPGGEIRCRRLLIATGGMSFPKTGTTGDGYRLAAALGHGLVAPVPALVPLVIEAPWIRELSGVSLEDAGLELRSRAGDTLASSRGPLLLTHKGLSGPAALDLGGAAARHGRRTLLELDWRPDLAPEVLRARFRESTRQGRRRVRRLLAEWVPERVAAALLAVTDVPEDRQAAQLRVEERSALVKAVKSTRLEVAGTLGFEVAEVTAGGVPLEETDPHTLASRIVPGLFIAGEALDYDGRLGGYNLQAAWCTGKAAGQAQAGSS